MIDDYNKENIVNDVVDDGTSAANKKTDEKLPNVAVITLGCKVNQYDSDAMLAVLLRGGFQVTEGFAKADFYVVNTCAVTAEAERKSRQAVRKILKINPDAEIYVCGCASQNNFSQFDKDKVAYISGTDGKLKLAEKLVAAHSKKQTIDPDDGFSRSEENLKNTDFALSDKFEDNEGIVNLRTRHFIKIQDGCDNYCSYCIVPYLRGRSRSRNVESIKRELDGVSKTVVEIVLTGINLSAYGNDIDFSLTELIEDLKDYNFRIRLGSLEVGIINDGFLNATTHLKQFCPHFHLSLQSGDDGVLKNMNRHYSTGEYLNAVKLIRSYYPNAGITTDIIVGFPTESSSAFENSLKFAREVAFSDIHVFPYSSRKGTVAGKLPTLPHSEVEERQRSMSALKKELITKFLFNQLNIEHKVLFETKEEGMWCGHTTNYVKVYSADGLHNCVQTVVPTSLYKDGLKV